MIEWSLLNPNNVFHFKIVSPTNTSSKGMGVFFVYSQRTWFYIHHLINIVVFVLHIKLNPTTEGMCFQFQRPFPSTFPFYTLNFLIYFYDATPVTSYAFSLTYIKRSRNKKETQPTRFGCEFDPNYSHYIFVKSLNIAVLVGGN